MQKLIHINEPALRFAHNQNLINPKDGLTLFGPFTQASGNIRYGVIGTATGIELFGLWLERIRGFIPAYLGGRFRTSPKAEHNKLVHQYFPGFQPAFGISWNDAPEITCKILDEGLRKALKVHERHTRVASVAKVYTTELIKKNYQSDRKPDLWFVIVPRQVYLYCRPRSAPPSDYLHGTRAEDAIQSDLFSTGQDEDNFYEEYQEALTFKPDFHNQLKARLLRHQVITQLLQEDTLKSCLKKTTEQVRGGQDPATTVWNASTSIFYKTRRRPWILSDAREGVCYIGLMFKRLNRTEGKRNACCGAQMFLEDGNGMVFKGALGPWYSEDTRECHLNEHEAGRLLGLAIASYADEHDGRPPREIFIHGAVRFSDEEWMGFSEIAKLSGVRVVGVRIRRLDYGIKLFRRGSRPILRGTALKVAERKAYLWTVGFTPRLNTYPGWNVPNPLDIEVCKGDADIETMLNDIMRLTKLNYNNCAFADGLPITLKFASRVGDILTTLPTREWEMGMGDDSQKPLPFWHYI